ncbi:hypothetical protein K1719_000193 [Acacia pycnantha]|nr:hypothetical protein K1719_000193 [Acacia pycnantha]
MVYPERTILENLKGTNLQLRSVDVMFAEKKAILLGNVVIREDDPDNDSDICSVIDDDVDSNIVTDMSLIPNFPILVLSVIIHREHQEQAQCPRWHISPHRLVANLAMNEANQELIMAEDRITLFSMTASDAEDPQTLLMVAEAIANRTTITKDTVSQVKCGLVLCSIADHPLSISEGNIRRCRSSNSMTTFSNLPSIFVLPAIAMDSLFRYGQQ